MPVITGPGGNAGDASSSVSVAENQTAVTTLTASETVTWSITGGADAALFTIDPTAGAVTFRNAPDYENPADAGGNNVYDIIVTATDGGNNPANQAVAITVTDVDETAPSITGPSGSAGDASSAISVDENQTAVTTLTASETVTWSISGGADAALFAINPATGVLTFRNAPDYENPNDAGGNNVYDVIVTATDSGNNTANQAIAVTVRDLDETAPSISGPSGGAGDANSSISVDENQTAVTTLTTNETVTWSITGGADAALFAINPTTGALTFRNAPDYENPNDTGGNNVYDVIVTATDGGNNTANQAIAVTVRDVDEVAPSITGPGGGAGDASSAISVDEEQTAVTTLTASETVTWSITGGADAARFAIDSATGTLTFVAAPDYEQPVDIGTNNVYDVIVTATDSGNNTASQSIAVTVRDIDDVAPGITGPGGNAGDASSAVSVNENQTAVTTLTANESVSWSISGGIDAALFTIDPATGVLTFRAAPDYEDPGDGNKDNVYQLTVTATDASNNTASQTIAVTVLDVDEVAPGITGPGGNTGDTSSAITVDEEQTGVTTLTASETVTWSIGGGADAALFTIDATTGVLTFIAAPDYENPADAGQNNVYDLVVSATDASSNVSTQNIAVTVVDIDDTAPRITGPSGSAGDASSAVSVNEGSSVAANFTADEPATWSITGGADAAQFVINNDGTLSFVTVSDYENPLDAGTNNVYDLIVTATDGSNNSSSQTVTVTVLDLDEIAPTIDGPSGNTGDASSAITVDEGTIAVTTLTASETVSWSITGGSDAARFVIDANSGALSFVAAPDYEDPVDSNQDNDYQVVVTATDASNNGSNQTVTVTVADIDDTAPVLGTPSGPGGASDLAISVNEEQTTVTTLTANESVTWSISGGTDAARFAIDANSGALTFIAAPDYENPVDGNTDNVYEVEVTATDANANAANQIVRVTVLDIDDAAPAIWIAGLGTGVARQTVDEGLADVATLTADETVTWSISGGADALRLSIDPATGKLTFVETTDYENPADANGDNDYVIEISATDANNNVTTLSMTITVADVDDTGPTIGGAEPSGALGLSIDEGLVPVITMSADETVTWAITGGPDAGRFSIDPATGALVFNIVTDFESPADADADNAYVIEVTATDSMGNSTVLPVTITVVDAAEIAEKINEIRDELSGDIRTHAMRSLGDMLSFNEDLMSSSHDDFCSEYGRKGLSGSLDADESQQNGKLDWSKTIGDCQKNKRVVLDAGTSISRLDGNWTTRGLGSVRFEMRATPDVLVGLGAMGSYADDSLPSFSDSAITDTSLQANAYVKARILPTLRFGAFAGLGRAWYDFSLSDDGLDLKGDVTGKRTAYGAMLSGDIPLGDLLITPDLALSHARENLGTARLRARYQGERADDLPLDLDSVDMTRLSVPVNVRYALRHGGSLDDNSTDILLTPGLLCEDHNLDSSALDCGYQLGAKVQTQAIKFGTAYIDYRYETVDDMERNLIGAGVSYRFGSSRDVELSLEGNRATALGGDDDYRTMIRLRLTP